MTRSLLALLCLLNYLLVLSAGLVNRPDRAADFRVVRPYVHHAGCQQQNYLRLDCFDTCNGPAAVQKKVPLPTAQHLLAAAKGIDAHCCLPVAAFSAVRPLISADQPRFGQPHPATLTRAAEPIEAPPQRA